MKFPTERDISERCRYETIIRLIEEYPTLNQETIEASRSYWRGESSKVESLVQETNEIINADKKKMSPLDPNEISRYFASVMDYYFCRRKK